MTERDNFIELFDDALLEVWNLKNNAERCDLSEEALIKVNSKLEEGWRALIVARTAVIKYEEKEKNNDK